MEPLDAREERVWLAERGQDPGRPVRVGRTLALASFQILDQSPRFPCPPGHGVRVAEARERGRARAVCSTARSASSMPSSALNCSTATSPMFSAAAAKPGSRASASSSARRASSGRRSSRSRLPQGEVGVRRTAGPARRAPHERLVPAPERAQQPAVPEARGRRRVGHSIAARAAVGFWRWGEEILPGLAGAEKWGCLAPARRGAGAHAR